MRVSASACLTSSVLTDRLTRISPPPPRAPLATPPPRVSSSPLDCRSPTMPCSCGMGTGASPASRAAALYLANTVRIVRSATRAAGAPGVRDADAGAQLVGVARTASSATGNALFLLAVGVLSAAPNPPAGFEPFSAASGVLVAACFPSPDRTAKHARSSGAFAALGGVLVATAASAPPRAIASVHSNSCCCPGSLRMAATCACACALPPLRHSCSAAAASLTLTSAAAPPPERESAAWHTLIAVRMSPVAAETRFATSSSARPSAASAYRSCAASTHVLTTPSRNSPRTAAGLRGAQRGAGSTALARAHLEQGEQLARAVRVERDHGERQRGARVAHERLAEVEAVRDACDDETRAREFGEGKKAVHEVARLLAGQLELVEDDDGHALRAAAARKGRVRYALCKLALSVRRARSLRQETVVCDSSARQWHCGRAASLYGGSAGGHLAESAPASGELAQVTKRALVAGHLAAAGQRKSLNVLAARAHVQELRCGPTCM